MLVVLKFNGIGSSITLEYFSQGDRSTPLFARDVIVKPIAHDSRINSTCPVKFRKLRSGGRVVHIHQKIPPSSKGKNKNKNKKPRGYKAVLEIGWKQRKMTNKRDDRSKNIEKQY